MLASMAKASGVWGGGGVGWKGGCTFIEHCITSLRVLLFSSESFMYLGRPKKHFCFKRIIFH